MALSDKHDKLEAVQARLDEIFETLFDLEAERDELECELANLEAQELESELVD